MKFLAAIVALAVTIVTDAQQLPFINCATGTSDFQIESFQLAVYPMCNTQDICFTAVGTLSAPITASHNLTLDLGFYGYYSKYKTVDLCDALAAQGTPCPVPVTTTSLTVCVAHRGVAADCGGWYALLNQHGALNLTLKDSSEKELSDLVLRNAQHIQYINFRSFPNPTTLFQLLIPCRNLRTLDCHLQYELPNDVNAILNLVEQNQGLEIFSLHGIPIKRLGLAKRFLHVLSQHPRLKRLEFTSADNKISEHLFKAILQSCPKSLETLILKWTITIQDDADFDFRDPHVSLPGWTHNSIKTLEFHKPLIEQESEAVTAAFVRACEHLKHVTIDSCSTVGSLLVDALISNSANLQKLSFEDSVFVSSSDLQRILTNCAALRTFVACEYFENNHETVLEIKDLVQSPWACRGLQVIDLTLGSDFGINTEEQDYAERRRRMVQQVYQQYATLTELWDLRFGYQVPGDNARQFPLDAENKNDFDMTLASGLEILGKLTRLERLNVVGLRHRMRKAEKEWLQERWPSLECFGLDMYEGEEISEDEEDEEDEESEEDERDEEDEGYEEDEEEDEVDEDQDDDKEASEVDE
ncbi:hypothetical protein BGX27_004823 [Mortierella sp. AM989]|nr:hypothetical protein BGX27_004823 [Mortierella sp. AM989]